MNFDPGLLLAFIAVWLLLNAAYVALRLWLAHRRERR